VRVREAMAVAGHGPYSTPSFICKHIVERHEQ
jgi:hypothetical protein